MWFYGRVCNVGVAIELDLLFSCAPRIQLASFRYAEDKGFQHFLLPIGSMYGIYANIGGILMVNVTIYGIHGSYGLLNLCQLFRVHRQPIMPCRTKRLALVVVMQERKNVNLSPSGTVLNVRNYLRSLLEFLQHWVCKQLLLLLAKTWNWLCLSHYCSVDGTKLLLSEVKVPLVCRSFQVQWWEAITGSSAWSIKGLAASLGFSTKTAISN